MERSGWRGDYIRRYYSSKPGWKHPYELWWDLIATQLTAAATVLEIGGGPTFGMTRRLRPMARRLIGLDVDPVIKGNSFLDLAIVYDGERFPDIDDNQIDVAVADWVNEHVANPATHFAEIGRVLKPGGVYVFRTVNRHHYKALGASLVPSSLQTPLARWLRQTPDDDYDPYRVYYRANTRRQIERLCEQAKLTITTYNMLEPLPSYGLGARPLFLALMAYERLVNASPIFAAVRHTIHCVARKDCMAGPPPESPQGDARVSDGGDV